MMGKINVLIVDDSRIFRSLVSNVLSKNNKINIIGAVGDGKQAINFLKQSPTKVDFVTLDIEMPVMNGEETLAEIQKINKSSLSRKKIEVIMISSLTQNGANITMRTLENGALDFIAKPENKNITESNKALEEGLLDKILSYSELQKSPLRTTISKGIIKPVSDIPRRVLSTNTSRKNQRIKINKIEAIIIGVSTGGPKALTQMLPKLCLVTKLPILIVQHMPATFTKSLADSLDRVCSHRVVEAKKGDKVVGSTVYVAQGGMHMLVKKQGLDYVIGQNNNQPENNCKPSVDVMFRSAAMAYKGEVISIILTGMGTDGTKSLSQLKRAGSYIIAQDRTTSVVWGMPGSAVNSGNVDEELALMDIPNRVKEIL